MANITNDAFHQLFYDSASPIIFSSFKLISLPKRDHHPSLYPQLSNELIIDSGATASCTPHRRYFIDSAFVDKSFTVAAAIMEFQANLAAHPPLYQSPFHINFATPTPSTISTLESTVQAAARSEVIDQLHININYFGRSPTLITSKSPPSKAVHFSLPPTTNVNALSLISRLSGTSKFPSVRTLSPTSNVAAPMQSAPIYLSTTTPLFLPLNCPRPSLALASATTSNTRLSNEALFRLQHNRLGHPSSTVLQGLVKTLPDFSTDRPRLFKPFTCDTFEFAKSRRHQFLSAAVFRASSFLLLVHTDIWGPCPVPSIGDSF
ncbi:hypothetical protein AaE_004053 [Aphanomyces astaci]|uniref:GAG-pre-integrase domain-containing protein n=1 Tax=Aphanomyces astaci TaxID=112090 RepID=A0A6A5AJD9_APHAT|nr:hypothetical protein AaE_004053 [Aphanomyces astaci]